MFYFFLFSRIVQKKQYFLKQYFLVYMYRYVHLSLDPLNGASVKTISFAIME